MSTHTKGITKGITKLAVVVLLVVALTSCDAGASSDPLANTRWQVTDYANPTNPTGMTTVWLDTTVTMEFGAGGELSGSSGCNSYSGTYAVSDTSLTVSSPLAATAMMCTTPEGVMEQEAVFLANLQAAHGYKLEDDQLHILNDEGQVTILAAKQ